MFGRSNGCRQNELQAAEDLHQLVHLASDGGPTRFEVLLHTQTRKERHHHSRQVIHSRLRLFCLDILGNELLQLHSAASQKLDRRGWQDGKLADRTDGETAFLPLDIARAELQKSLNVVPA